MKGLIAFLFQHGRSRWLPAILLLLACLLLPHAEETPLVTLRNAQFDHYQRLMPRQRLTEPAVVIEIDSASIEKFGPWPWPRRLVASLINRLQDAGALAIGIDVVLAEPDQYSHALLAQRLPELASRQRANLPEPDRILAEALAAGRTVLAVAGTTRALPGSRLPNKPLNGFRISEEAQSHLTHYASSLTSLPMLAQAAHGEGLVNATPDSISSKQERGVLRRLPSVGIVEFMPLLSLPFEMVRQHLGSTTLVNAETDASGMTRLHIGGHSLPVQPNGEILLHFGRPTANYYLSAADVMAGHVPKQNLAGRFAFIGVTTSGLQDRVITPLGDNLPGVDIHVQMLESLLDGKALQRPIWLPRFELAILTLWGALLILLIPVLQPRFATLTFVGCAAAILGAGYLSFALSLHLFDGASIVLLQSPIFIALLSSTLIAADRRRQQAEKELQISREAAARAAGELGAARRIQMGLLPNPTKVFAAEKRFEIAALLEPASDIGGDYYDCFYLDASRICLAIGDVSGKGVPASLFMAMSKTLSGALTRRNVDLGLALREVEVELNRENSEYLFVTTLVAVLNADSGALDYAVAGHDAPMLLRNGEISRLATEETSGPPLCAVGDFPYVSAKAQLQAGDVLCLFTDGASEASNGSAFFGTERLATALASSGEGQLTERLSAINNAILTFEAGAPPHDDLTLLLLQFNGR